jgi:hypothetical protein
MRHAMQARDVRLRTGKLSPHAGRGTENSLVTPATALGCIKEFRKPR